MYSCGFAAVTAQLLCRLKILKTEPTQIDFGQSRKILATKINGTKQKEKK
jgi:hypothetical protein